MTVDRISVKLRITFWACREGVVLGVLGLLYAVLLPGAAASPLSAASSQPTAVEEFAKINRQAHRARVAGDKQGYLAAALQMEELLNRAPSAVEAVAKAYAAAGDAPHAIAMLNQFAGMGQVDDGLSNGKDQNFTILLNLPQYKLILDRFTANRAAVSRSETAFILSDAGLVAEDIDYDPRSNSFLVTSVREKKIVRVNSDGRCSGFADSPSHWPMLALKIDSGRRLAWATEVAIDGFAAVPKTDWGRSAVLRFNLDSGALLDRVEGPAHAALGDMVLESNGDPIVSDGDGGGVYRLRGGRLEKINGSDFISPQTPAMLLDGRHVFVPDYVRGIGVEDLESGRVVWLGKDHPGTYALSGVDGLYFDRGALFVTQNGTSPERVVRLQLNRELTEIMSEEIIERATPTLGDPTHGVMVGDSFLYIANSGWNNLDEHGEVKPGSKLTPARVMKFARGPAGAS
jgi:sugar lactone lactonase YvrE